jgi:hypothetical protein
MIIVMDWYVEKTTVGRFCCEGRRRHVVNRRNCGTDFAMILGQR